MVLFNYSTKELTAKVVYYGPGLCGKTTNLQYIHGNLPETVKGKMLSLATKTDRTLFFDFLPLDLGTIRGMKTRIQLYTVPGQVFYNETRKLVLKGADGIVFVADSQEQMMGANVESFRNLEDNLRAHGMDLAELPHVIQFNKRDLPKLSSIESLNSSINKFNAPFYESVATTGIGVQDTLKAITKLVLLHLTQKYDPKARPAAARTPAPAPVRTPQPPAEAPSSSIPLSAHEEAPAAPIPVASATPPAPGPPPPPEFNAAQPEDDLPSFGETEIDDLVGEVAESNNVTAPPPETEELPSFETPATPQVEDGPFPMDEGGQTVQVPVPPMVDEQPPVPVAPMDTLGDVPAVEPEIEMEVPLAAAPPVEANPDQSVGGGFEIDRDFDPEWSPETPGQPPAAEPIPSAPMDASVVAAAPETAGDMPFPTVVPEEVEETRAIPLDEPQDAEPVFASEPAVDPVPMPVEDPPAAEPHLQAEPVLLTEVAGQDDALFADPSLEVTRLEPGGAREIVVPVEIGEGSDRRRFKLSVTLRLDPVK